MKLSLLLKPFKFIFSLGPRLRQYIADLEDMAPYHLRLLTESYGGGKAQPNRSDFTYREQLIYSWLAMDHVYYGRISSEAARHWICLGDLHSGQRYPASGRRFYEKAVAILTQICEPRDKKLLEAMKKLADCFRACARPEDALKLYLDISGSPDLDLPMKVSVQESLRDTYIELADYLNACQANEAIIEIVESGNLKDCLLSVSYYEEMARLLDLAGEVERADFYHGIKQSLDWYSIILKGAGRESSMLKSELEKLLPAFVSKGRESIVSEIKCEIRIIELTAFTKRSPYPGMARDLVSLAELLEARADGGDLTVAFHCRSRAKRILEKSEGRSRRDSSIKGLVSGIFVSFNTMLEALSGFAFEVGYEFSLALSYLV